VELVKEALNTANQRVDILFDVFGVIGAVVAGIAALLGFFGYTEVRKIQEKGEKIQKVDEEIDDLKNRFKITNEAYGLFRLGEIYYENKNYVFAIKSLVRARNLLPNDPEINLRLGQIHVKQKEFDKAIAALTKTIELAPDNIEAYKVLGFSYRRRGERDNNLRDYHEAIRYLNKVLQLDSSNLKFLRTAENNIPGLDEFIEMVKDAAARE
jgi:tetratricopeptide (TPR) repeat protein